MHLAFRGPIKKERTLSRVANDHDRDQIFGLDRPIPTDYRGIFGWFILWPFS